MGSKIQTYNGKSNGELSNPFQQQNHRHGGMLTTVEENRALAEVQAQSVLAKRFPRDEDAARERILRACERPSLAEDATYAYPRGNTTVAGPSIRLAETIAQRWGNLTFGIRELDQRDGESIVEAYAWDLETNVRQSKTFTVKHVRKSGKDVYALTDPRDIYEVTANQGARRLRACILGIIPRDVVDDAVDACHRTVQDAADITDEQIQNIVQNFLRYGITREQIEARLGREMETMTETQYGELKSIYAAVRDNYASAADFFDDVPAKTKAPAETKGATPPPAASEVKQYEPPSEHDDEDAPTEEPAAGEADDEPADSSSTVTDHSRYGNWQKQRRRLGQLLRYVETGEDTEDDEVLAAIAWRDGKTALEHVDPKAFEAIADRLGQTLTDAPEGEPSERDSLLEGWLHDYREGIPADGGDDTQPDLVV